MVNFNNVYDGGISHSAAWYFDIEFISTHSENGVEPVRTITDAPISWNGPLSNNLMDNYGVRQITVSTKALPGSLISTDIDINYSTSYDNPQPWFATASMTARLRLKSSGIVSPWSPFIQCLMSKSSTGN